MERGIVLADELVQLDFLGVLPPLLPLIGIACRNGWVSDASIEPNVEDLVLITWKRNRHAPFQIARDAPALETFCKPRACNCNSVGRPLVLLV